MDKSSHCKIPPKGLILLVDIGSSERIMRNGDKKLIDKGHDERGTHSYRAGGAEPVRRSL